MNAGNLLIDINAMLWVQIKYFLDTDDLTCGVWLGIGYVFLETFRVEKSSLNNLICKLNIRITSKLLVYKYSTLFPYSLFCFSFVQPYIIVGRKIELGSTGLECLAITTLANLNASLF